MRIFAGCEVDILVDGRMDFEDSVLAELDFVIASPHISLKQDERKPPIESSARSRIDTST